MQLTDAHLALFAHLVETGDLTTTERNELRSAILLARKPALQFRPVDGAHLTNGGRWDYPGAGRWILHLVAHNPDRWLQIGNAADRRALRMATSRAAAHLAGIDPHLAKALAPAHERDGPGVRFRSRDGRAEVMWRRPPGVSVAVGVILA